MSILEHLRNYISTRKIFTGLALIILSLNIFYLFVFARIKYNDKTEWFEPGYQFRMFVDPLRHVDQIGYITDKKLTRESNDGAYLQSQYYLAPVLVNPGYSGDEFNIIDSENWQFILENVQRYKFKRIANNLYGQALMRRRP